MSLMEKMNDRRWDKNTPNWLRKRSIMDEKRQGNRALWQTKCDRCQRMLDKQEEAALPVVVETCSGCAKKAANANGKVKMLNKDTFVMGGFYCSMCGGKSWHRFVLNLRLCRFCLNRIGRNF